MKVLFLQEYIRENHMKRTGDRFSNVFMSTEAGKLLRRLVEDENGLGLGRGDYYIDYAYSLVPTVVARDNYDRAQRYKPPTAREQAEEYKFLSERIVREKPDIIIPTGAIGCKMLLNKTAITTLRGVPERVTITSGEEVGDNGERGLLLGNIESSEELLGKFTALYSSSDVEGNYELRKELEDLQGAVNHHKQVLEEYDRENPQGGSHTAWVLPMFSMEYMLVNPNIQNLVEADFVTLNKYIKEGDKAFDAKKVDYDFLDTLEKVEDLFQNKIKTAPVVAWDLETNTLRPEMSGAKPLVISISIEEGGGYTIPLEHKDFKWGGIALDRIYHMIREFVADPNIVKVGHNI